MSWIDTYINKAAGRYRLHSTDSFKEASTKLTIHITAIYTVCGLLYSLTFLSKENYLVAIVAVLVSLFFLIIPVTLSKENKRFVFYSMFILVGTALESFLIFGSGNSTNFPIILWQIFFVHLTLATLTRKVALFFGIAMLSLVLVKNYLVSKGVSFPYWIPEVLVQNPRSIDIILPAFFSFYLAYTSHKLFKSAREQIKKSNESIVRLDSRILESERQYRLLVESSPAIINVHNEEGKLIFVNQSMCEATGKSKAELEKMSIQDFISAKHLPKFQDYLLAIKNNGIAEGLMKVKEKQKVQYVYYRSSVISGPGEEMRILGYGQDVTELETARQFKIQQEMEMRKMPSGKAGRIYRGGPKIFWLQAKHRWKFLKPFLRNPRWRRVIISRRCRVASDRNSWLLANWVKPKDGFGLKSLPSITYN
jgi:PAS domain S-box-containing protein